MVRPLSRKSAQVLYAEEVCQSRDEWSRVEFSCCDLRMEVVKRRGWQLWSALKVFVSQGWDRA